MKNPGEYLQTFNESWTGAREILGAIGYPDCGGLNKLDDPTTTFSLRRATNATPFGGQPLSYLPKLIMQTTLHLNADDLDISVIEKIRNAFAHQPIKIEPDLPSHPDAKNGILAQDLSNFLLALPRLSNEETESFKADVEAIRRDANAAPYRDPWAS
jgi:hypothetical protein